MRNLALLAVFLALPITGCHVTAATPATAPTGARDSIDAAANLALQPAHAFALSISQSIQSGKLQLTQTQLDVVNALNGALNVADAGEIAYHNSVATETAAALNAAVAAAVAAFNNAQSVFNSITK